MLFIPVAPNITILLVSPSNHVDLSTEEGLILAPLATRAGNAQSSRM